MRNHLRTIRCVVVALCAFCLSSLAQAQTYTYSIFHQFQNNGTDPSGVGRLVIDSSGNLYGLSSSGGSKNFGTVFEVTASGKLTVLHSFTPAEGGSPANLARNSETGNLYGTTVGNYPEGTVFELEKQGDGNYSLKTLFSSKKTNMVSLSVDSNGNVYGADDWCNCVFEIPAGGEWTDVYNTGGQPVEPVGNVLISESGTVYASIQDGEINGHGWVAKVNGVGVFFPPFSWQPNSLVQDAAGNIYGLADGGSSGGPSLGIIFKLNETPPWTTVIYSFKSFLTGAQPAGSFAVDSEGNLYGTATGGIPQYGVVFKVTPQGEETVLHTFTDGYGCCGLVMDGAGNLYGTSAEPGANPNPGYIWKLTLESPED